MNRQGLTQRVRRNRSIAYLGLGCALLLLLSQAGRLYAGDRNGSTRHSEPQQQSLAFDAKRIYRMDNQGVTRWHEQMDLTAYLPEATEQAEPQVANEQARAAQTTAPHSSDLRQTRASVHAAADRDVSMPWSLLLFVIPFLFGVYRKGMPR